MPKSSYRPGDKVYLSVPGSRGVQGPFLIAKVPSTAKYTLCQEDGTPAHGGNEVEEKNLNPA